MYRLLTASIGIVAVALLALGCGSSSEAGEATEALTKAQFIKRADQACADVMKKREAAAESWRKEHPNKVSAEELSDGFKEVMVPSVQEQIEALQDLPAPAADRAEVARMLDNLTEANRNFEKEGAEGAQQPEASQFEAEARKYGLKICPRLY